MIKRESKHRRVVFLGDPLQAIDGWRGTTEQWLGLNADTQLTLRETHRFTPDLAAVVNTRLRQHFGRKSDFIVAARSVQDDGGSTMVYRSSDVNEKIGRTRLYPAYYRSSSFLLFLDAVLRSFVSTLLTLSSLCTDLFADLYDIMRHPDSPSTIRILSSSSFHPAAFLQCCNHAWHLFHGRPLPESDDPLVQPYCGLKRFPTWAAFKHEVASWESDLPRPSASSAFSAWHVALML